MQSQHPSQPDQPDQPDQTGQTDQTDQTDQDRARPGQPGRTRRRGLLRTAGLLAAAALLALAGLALPGTVAQAASAKPCDIYASGGTPCVAAHSTTRALYSTYNSGLYQVKRASDGATLDIVPRSAGGSANAAAQDTFCAGTTCLITKIYDQSGHGNTLTQAPPGGFDGPDVDGYDNLAGADAAPVTVGGHRAYGVFISPGTGYRNNNTSGIATGDEAEGMYAVLDGTHYNDGCCFDYGNAETNSLDTGNGHMETIYFGGNSVWGTGAGEGPWIMADLENGLFSGLSSGYNANDPSVSHRFLTAVVKGKSNRWAIRGGNAQSGTLSTYYEGARPSVSGYNPMSKEGAIILGIGGDNSNGSAGTFYEGVMTSGYPSASTESAVQANIVAANYQTTPIVTGTQPTVGSVVSLRATTSGIDSHYLSHSGSTVSLSAASSSSSSTVRAQASWTVRTGLADSQCVSLESKDTPGSYLRHSGFQLYLNADDGTSLFAQDATFCPQTGASGTGTTLRSWNYPTRSIRHFAYSVYIASNGGVLDWDAATLWSDDVSWALDTGLSS